MVDGKIERGTVKNGETGQHGEKAEAGRCLGQQMWGGKVSLVRRYLVTWDSGGGPAEPTKDEPTKDANNRRGSTVQGVRRCSKRKNMGRWVR